MQYNQNELAALGKQVAAGRYVNRSTAVLAIVLAFLVGLMGGRYVIPSGGTLASEENVVRRPLDTEKAAADMNRQQAEAILNHEEEARKNPANHENWVHLGNLYFDAQKPAESVAAYEKALAIKPDDAPVLVDCGVMYRELKQYDKALAYFNKALGIDPKHEIALFNTGIVLFFDLNKKAEGLASWEKLLAVNPNAKAPNGQPLADMIKELKS